jgi:hypothetical protein
MGISTFAWSQEALRIERSVMVQGDADWDWTQARTAVAPTYPTRWFTTLSKTAKQGAHGYHDVYLTTSTDRGRTWTQPEVIPALRRAKQPDGYEVVAGDLWPKYHSATGKILVTGKTFNFENGTKENSMLGNSGVCQISETETWLTVAEGGVSRGKRQGENNKVILAKVFGK